MHCDDAVSPDEALYVPGAQSKQSAGAATPDWSLHEPGGHGEHDESPLSEYVPGPQSVQFSCDVAPVNVVTLPAGQPRQSLAASAPGTGLYVPRAQGRHWDSAVAPVLVW